MDARVKLDGFEDLAAKLRELPQAMRKRVLRNALAAGGRLVRNEAKRAAPLLKSGTRAPFRKRGTLRDAIKVRTSKIDRRNGDVGVFVNVKPLNAKASSAFKGRGAKNPDDPYYWQWLEFGRKGRTAGTKVYRGKGDTRKRKTVKAVGPIAPMRFLQGSAKRFPEALSIFKAQVAAWIEKANRTGKVVP